MNKYFISVLFILSSCVTEIKETKSSLIKGNYKLELIKIHRLGNTTTELDNHVIETSKDTFEVRLGDIANDVMLDFKLSKIESSSNTISNNNAFKLNIIRKKGPAFEIKFNDCSKAIELGSFCNFVILTKWAGGENVEIGENDFIDIELKEEINTLYEEPVIFNLSIDTHRKQKSTVNYSTILESVNFGTSVDFFTSLKETLNYMITGELDYTLTYTFENNIEEAFDFSCKDNNRNINCDLFFLRLKANNYNFTNSPAKLNIIVTFENELNPKPENIKTLNLIGRRKAPPIITFSPGTGNITEDAGNNVTFTVINSGENKSVVDNLSFNLNELYQNPICNSAFVSEDNTCNQNSEILSGTTSNCSIKVKADHTILTGETCIATLSYSGDNSLIKEELEVFVNATPSKLLICENSSCTNEITTPLIYSDTVIGNNSTKTIYLKNIGENNDSIHVLKARNITYNFSNSAFIILNNNCGTTIDGGVTCSIDIKFTPTVSQLYDINLNIKHNDASLLSGTFKDNNLNIKGRGLNPANIVFSSPDNFEEIVLNESLGICNINEPLSGAFIPCEVNTYYKAKTRTITISNNGEYRAKINSISSASSSFIVAASGLNNNCGEFLEIANTCSFMVTFVKGNFNDTNNGAPISTLLTINYYNGANTPNSTKTINGTILVPGVLEVFVDDINQPNNANIDFGSVVYNNTPKVEKSIRLKNLKTYATKIKIENLILSVLNDHDGYVDDYEIIDTENCIGKTINASVGVCTLTAKFQPIGEIDYAAHLEYFEKLKLNDLNTVQRIKNYKLEITYDNTLIPQILFNLNLNGKSLKPAELLIESISYNTATDPTSKQINRASTSYQKDRRYVNLCTDGINSSYRLFSSLASSTCSDLNSGVPFQNYWDFDKSYHANINTNGTFTIYLKNIGGIVSNNLTYVLDNNNSIKIEPNGNVNALSVIPRDLNFDPNSTNTGEIVRNLIGLKYKDSAVNTWKYINYSDYTSGNNLTLYGYSLVLPGITSSHYKIDGISNSNLETFYGAGTLNKNASFELIFTFTPNFVSSPYNTNMTSSAFSITNINGPLSSGTNSFFTSEVSNNFSTTPTISTSVLSSNYSPLSTTREETITVSNIVLKDLNNNLCGVYQNNTQYFTYKVADLNKFNSKQIDLTYNINSSNRLKVTSRPALAFSSSQALENAEKVFFCSANFGDSIGNNLLSLNNIRLRNFSNSNLTIDFDNLNSYYANGGVNDFLIEDIDCGEALNSGEECFVNFNFQRNTIDLDNAKYDWYYYLIPYYISSNSYNYKLNVKAFAETGVLGSNEYSRSNGTPYYVHYYDTLSNTKKYQWYFCYDCNIDYNRIRPQVHFGSNFINPYFFHSIEVNLKLALNSYENKKDLFNYLIWEVHGYNNYLEYDEIGFPLPIHNEEFFGNGYGNYSLDLKAKTNFEINTPYFFDTNNEFNKFYNFTSGVPTFKLRFGHGYYVEDNYVNGIKNDGSFTINYLEPNEDEFRIISKNELIQICQILNDKIYLNSSSPVFGDATYKDSGTKYHCCSANLNIQNDLHENFCN